MQRVEPRATAVHLMKCLTEMAQAGIAHLHGGLSDIAPPGTQQLGRSFQPELPEILRNGQPSGTGENPTQMKRTATHLPPDFLQTRRLRQICPEQRHDPFRPLAREPMLPLAKQLRLPGSLIEKLGRHLQCFARIPDRLGGGQHRGFAQAGQELLLPGGQPHRLRHGGIGRPLIQYLPHQRMQTRLASAQMAADKIERHLHGQKLVLLPPDSGSRQGSFPPAIQAHHQRLQSHGRHRAADARFPREIQANLQTLRMKTTPPIKLLRCREIMPLETDSQMPNIPMQMPPARADGSPDGSLRK